MIQNFVAFQFIQPNETNKQTTTKKQKSKEEKKKEKTKKKEEEDPLMEFMYLACHVRVSVGDLSHCCVCATAFGH